MIEFGMPALAELSEREKAALCRRLGLSFIHNKDDACLRLEQAMDDGQRDALLLKAETEGRSVLLEAESVEELEKAVLWVNLWRNRMCEPEELWDIYDAEGRLTGRTHLRREPLGEGEYHLCVHVWTQNSKGEFLLTKRSENKSMPGLWESTGGSVTAGEDSFTAALREVREETGIELEPAAGELLFRYGGDHFHCDVWLFKQDFDLSEVKLLEGETCAAMAASREIIKEMLENDEFVRYEYVEEFIKKA